VAEVPTGFCLFIAQEASVDLGGERRKKGKKGDKAQSPSIPPVRIEFHSFPLTTEERKRKEGREEGILPVSASYLDYRRFAFVI